MGRLVYALAFVAVVVSAAVIVVTSAGLPPMVASHFNAAGGANGSMPRDDYRLLMLVLAVAIPAAILVALCVLPRMSTGLVNLPNARAWLAPRYREETLATLGISGAICAIILTAFICATQLLVVRANTRTPPLLDFVALGAVVGGFLFALVLWGIALILRFRKPPA